ncbi:MAG: YncE family protein [Solirubrobacteraceae bacterium]
MSLPTRTLPGIALAALIAGCGATRAPQKPDPGPRASHRSAAVPHQQPVATRVRAGAPITARALVTAETENRLIVVALPSGRLVRRVPLPPGPEYVATCCKGSGIVVVSVRAGKVVLLDPNTLRVVKTFGGFSSPHVPLISGDYVYVTDDARGTLTTIQLSNMKVTSRVSVGIGAHHMSFSPDQRQLWIALGESAGAIAILTTIVSTPPPPSSPVGDPGRPRMVGQFSPGFPAHDLSFTPDSRQVWVTSATGPDVAVFDAGTHRLLSRVPVGPPPQHVAFDGRYAYLTSGYGSTIEQVAIASGRVLRRTSAPYGSFEVDAAGGYVVTSSLLRGTLAIYNSELKRLHVRKLTSAARDVAISLG